MSNTPSSPWFPVDLRNHHQFAAKSDQVGPQTIPELALLTSLPTIMARQRELRMMLNGLHVALSLGDQRIEHGIQKNNNHLCGSMLHLETDGVVFQGMHYIYIYTYEIF